jgi:hypothetical protein
MGPIVTITMATTRADNVNNANGTQRSRVASVS